MTRPDADIRRRADGSIDYGHYDIRARRLRSDRTRAATFGLFARPERRRR
jgi:hypothetical protein